MRGSLASLKRKTHHLTQLQVIPRWGKYGRTLILKYTRNASSLNKNQTSNPINPLAKKNTKNKQKWENPTLATNQLNF